MVWKFPSRADDWFMRNQHGGILRYVLRQLIVTV